MVANARSLLNFVKKSAWPIDIAGDGRWGQCPCDRPPLDADDREVYDCIMEVAMPTKIFDVWAAQKRILEDEYVRAGPKRVRPADSDVVNSDKREQGNE